MVGLAALAAPIVALLFQRGRVRRRRHGVHRPGPGRLRGGSAGVRGHAHRRADVLRARRRAHAGVRRARFGRGERRPGARAHVAARPHGARPRVVAVVVREPRSVLCALLHRRHGLLGGQGLAALARAHADRIGDPARLVRVARARAPRSRRVVDARSRSGAACSCTPPPRPRCAPPSSARCAACSAAAGVARLAFRGRAMIEFAMRLGFTSSAPMVPVSRRGRRRGVVVSAPPTSHHLMDPVAEFLGTLQVERGASPNTLAAYRRDLEGLRRFLRTESAAIFTRRATPELIRYLGWLRRRGLGSRSLARHLAAVRGLYRHLLETGEVARDPTEHLDTPRPPRRLPRTLSAERRRRADRDAGHDPARRTPRPRASRAPVRRRAPRLGGARAAHRGREPLRRLRRARPGREAASGWCPSARRRSAGSRST